MNFLSHFDTFDAWAMDKLGLFGLSEDKLKLVIYFFFCIPLGIAFSYIKSANQRIVFNIIFGVFFTLMLAREWIVFVNATAIAVYLISKVPSKNTVIQSIVVCFIALSYVHIFRQWFDYLSWKLDFSVIQMTVTCRLVYYIIDMSDNKVQDSFLLYYSYVFMFSNIMIGPVPYHSYRDLIYKENNYANVKRNYRKVFKEFSKALLLSAGEIYLRPYFDYDWYDSPKWSELNLIEKNLLQAVIGMCARLRYFAGFKYTQAAMDAIGITFNAETNALDRYPTCDYSYESEKSAIQKTVKWNSNVQVWLKYCFFDKFQKRFSVQISYYMTYGISALWHGFYLGYYQTFFWWALINQNCKYAFRARNKFSWLPEKARHIGAWLYCTFTMNIIAMTMALLDWDKGLKFNNDMYWSGQIAILFVFFFFYFTQWGQRK